jgi:hypothetical protein
MTTRGVAILDLLNLLKAKKNENKTKKTIKKEKKEGKKKNENKKKNYVRSLRKEKYQKFINNVAINFRLKFKAASNSLGIFSRRTAVTAKNNYVQLSLHIPRHISIAIFIV